MNKRIIILGGGESGTGAALLAKKRGIDIFLSDSGAMRDFYREELRKNGIEWEEGKHSEDLLDGAVEVIKSPGIPDSVNVVRKAKQKRIPVISEIEFAGRFTSSFTVCVTGSNGKTTTSSLIYHMMKKAGLNAGLAGNTGNSFARMVAEQEHDYYCLELSSFQLEGIVDFRPDIAILLNITADHLDRYNNDIQEYVNAKFKIAGRLQSSDAFIWCRDDKISAGEMKKREIRASLYPVSFKKLTGHGAYIDNNRIVISTSNKKMEMTLEELALKGRHNVYNSMAAGIAGQLLRIRKEVIRESLSDFQGIEHRLETVLRVHGIDFINDSKATNVNSSWYALESMNKKVVWIAGGIDKGNDYSALEELVREKVRAIVCLGADNSKLKKAFADSVTTLVETASMEEAVSSAYYLAKNGDVVLLSPACASFDLFENFEDRGRQFKSCVKNL
ncbi:MAG: UDP-N-acetylmuramoyl-L-alanine--D-glutamate ligase [Bacteroidales bacterium]